MSRVLASASVCLLVLASCGGGGGGAGPAANQPPVVGVTAPTQDVESPQDAPGTVLVGYVDFDADDVATTDLVGDRDGDPATLGDQVLIAADRPDQDGTPQTVTWDLTGVPPGTYTVFAIVTDGQETVSASAPGLVFVNASPSLLVTSPSTDVAVSRGAPVTVQYVDDDADDTALTWVFADRDGNLDTTADTTVVATARPEANGATRTAAWDTTGDAFGAYRILASTWDGTNAPVVRTAAGRVTVQNSAFATSAGGTGTDRGYGIAALASGGCIVVGGFEGSATFGLGEANETTLTAAAGTDVFVAKYFASGALDWAKATGGAGEEAAYSVTAFADGSFVVTGFFTAAVTFGVGDPTQTTKTPLGTDLFLARYGSTGALAWVKTAGGVGAGAIGVSVAALSDSGVVATGTFLGNVTFGAGEGGQTTLTGAASLDVFVARFASTGTLTWARKAAGSGSEEGYGIAAFSDGSSVVTGYFDGVLTFGAGEPAATTLTPFGLQEVFVAKYSSTGTLVWATQEGGLNGLAAGTSVTAFGDGTCAVAGWFSEYMDFGFGEPNQTSTVSAGGFDSFVLRLAGNGTLVWATQQYGIGLDAAYGVVAQPDGSCVVAGQFELGAVFGGGEPNATILYSTSTVDLFLARLDRDGALVWVSQAGGTSTNVLPQAVATFADGSLGVTGTLDDGGVMFGAGDNLGRAVFSAGLEDVFVARFNGDGGF